MCGARWVHQTGSLEIEPRDGRGLMAQATFGAQRARRKPGERTPLTAFASTARVRLHLLRRRARFGRVDLLPESALSLAAGRRVLDAGRMRRVGRLCLSHAHVCDCPQSAVGVAVARLADDREAEGGQAEVRAHTRERVRLARFTQHRGRTENDDDGAQWMRDSATRDARSGTVGLTARLLCQ